MRYNIPGPAGHMDRDLTTLHDDDTYGDDRQRSIDTHKDAFQSVGPTMYC